ncbi:MAG: hypothetical protein ABSE73_00145 [Planctomycetota bacterium]
MTPRRLRALALLDFRQNLVDIWRGSNSAVRREILDCVSLNRRVSDVSLVLEKRKPFDFLAERPYLKNGRDNKTAIELLRRFCAGIKGVGLEVMNLLTFA